MESKEIKSFGIGLGIGLLIGASVGILFAPQKGEDTRKLIKEKSQQFHGKAKDVVKKVKDTAALIKLQSPIAVNIDKIHSK